METSTLGTVGMFARLTATVDKACVQRKWTVAAATSKYSLFSLAQSRQSLSPWQSGYEYYQPCLPACTWAGLSVPLRKRSTAELASVPIAVSLTEDGTGKVGKASPSDPAKSFPLTKEAQVHTC